MSDDLVRRLAFPYPKDEDVEEVTLPVWVISLTTEAADRIEELEKACKEWSEVSQSNYQRAKAAEAKLVKVEVLMSAGFAEYERRLAELLEIGDVMATSIEGNYYIAGISTKWRGVSIKIKGEQP